MSEHAFDGIPRARQSEIISKRDNPAEMLKILAQGGPEAEFVAHLLGRKGRRNKRAVVIQTMVPH